MSTDKLASFLSSRKPAHEAIPLADQQLFEAVYESNLAAVLTALANGASADPREYGSSTDMTPLMIAALHGETDVCSALLSAKANPNLTDYMGWTPLHFASFNSDDSCYKALVAHGANEHQENKDGATPARLSNFHKPAAPRR